MACLVHCQFPQWDQPDQNGEARRSFSASFFPIACVSPNCNPQLEIYAPAVEDHWLILEDLYAAWI